jgi:hypothetical protein
LLGQADVLELRHDLLPRPGVDEGRLALGLPDQDGIALAYINMLTRAGFFEAVAV